MVVLKLAELLAGLGSLSGAPVESNAWTEAAGGTFGVSAPFYTNYRWQRQPAESMGFGRNFRIGKEGKYNLQLRAEFQNIFNRVFYSAPGVNGPGAAITPTTKPVLSNGVNIGGYGYIATVNGVGAQPRSGQAVMRFTF